MRIMNIISATLNLYWRKKECGISSNDIRVLMVSVAFTTETEKKQQLQCFCTHTTEKFQLLVQWLKMHMLLCEKEES